LKRGYDKAVAEPKQQTVALPSTPLGSFAGAPEVQPHPVAPEMEVARNEPPHTVVPCDRPTNKRQRKEERRSGRHGSSLDGRAKHCCSTIKSPATKLPSALRGTIRVEPIALQIRLAYYSLIDLQLCFYYCRCDYNELLLIRNSITRQKGWYRKPPKFWVIWESIAVFYLIQSLQNSYANDACKIHG